MRSIGVIDCGTTNSRCNIVDLEGRVIGSASAKIGVKDTAITGTSAALKAGLRSLFRRTLESTGKTASDLDLVISSGMITSELGILELPHMVAPAGLDEIASGLTRIVDGENLDLGSEFYLVRGIKNAPNPGENTPLSTVRHLDFMRGEETQVMGLLALHGGGIPTTIVNLSSHTKYISVDAQDRILGSVTTLSGQVYESLLKETFLGKSVMPGKNDTTLSDEGLLNPRLQEATQLAAEIVRDAGLLRSFLIPRFMDTLMSTDWRIRKRFFEACLIADDLRALSLFPEYGFDPGKRIFLVGLAERCAIFETLFRGTEAGKFAELRILSDPGDIQDLAIHGALAIAHRAGLI